MKVIELLNEFRGRIIDVHSHVGSDQRYLLNGNVDYIVKVMDIYGICKCFISAVQSLIQNYKEGNKVVLSAIQKYPDKFLGLVSVNPYYEDEAINELRKYIALGFVGVKLHPVYFNIPMTDELTYKVLEEIEKLRVPAMIHSYDGGKEVEKVAKDFPNLTIVMYHMGGALWKEGIMRVKRLDNVFVEISSSVSDIGMVEMAVKELGYERVLFGVDMPYLDPAVALGKVLGANISKEAKEAILCENALKLLK